jgi:hypothetical protein
MGMTHLAAPTSVDALLSVVLPRLEAVKGPSVGGDYAARCPFHEDRHPSFSINARSGLWQCHAADCGRKGNAHELTSGPSMWFEGWGCLLILWGLVAFPIGGLAVLGAMKCSYDWPNVRLPTGWVE